MRGFVSLGLAPAVGSSPEPTAGAHRPLAWSRLPVRIHAIRYEKPGSKAATEIDAILDSGPPKDEVREMLAPFAAVGGSGAEFETKTGLDLGFGVGGGPGVMPYTLLGCGLQLVLDPDDKIRVSRRSRKSVGGTDHPETPVSANTFSGNGYSRYYTE